MKIKKTFFQFISLFMFLSLSCSYSYKITILPEDAEFKVRGAILNEAGLYETPEKEITLIASKMGYKDYEQAFNHNDFFETKEIQILLEKKVYEFSLSMLGGPSEFIIDNTTKGITPANIKLSHGKHQVVLRRKNYEDQIIPLDVKGSTELLLRHQEKNPGLVPVGIFSCGSQPKQVIFSPENDKIYITLLNGPGYEIFDLKKKEHQKLVMPANDKKAVGFVEGIFLKKYNTFFVSQMDGNALYEYEYKKEQVRKRKLSTHGAGPKIIAYTDKLDLIATSNWFSNDVVILDYKTGKLIKKIKNLKTPRGLVFTNDGKFLIVASFNGGFIKKFQTSDWKEVGHIYKPGASMRHAVILRDDSKCWVNDMYHKTVHEIDVKTFTIIKTYKVFDNPNTMALTPDESHLFVSCRGPNNPKSYLYRSPVNGQIKGINLKKQEVVFTIYGGNQPTGLDISDDGKFLCFSNFKDDTFEIYDLGVIYESNQKQEKAKTAS